MGRGLVRVRRLVIGLGVIGLLVGGFATRAEAAPKAVPSKQDIQRLVQDMKLTPPAVGVPKVDPKNPVIPPLPYVQVPRGLNAALGVLSPVSFVVCQGAYLAPLGGVVAMTVLLDSLPTDSIPVQPSFLNPLFSPITTACVLAPFPRFTSCKGDAAVTKVIETASKKELPSVGAVSVDPFDFVPAPYASLVVEVDALQKAISYYALNRQPLAGDPTAKLAEQLVCK